jgi:hypothetical protein
MRIFCTWTAAQGYLDITIVSMTMWAALYYLPLYYKGVLGYSLIIRAVATLPLTIRSTPRAAVIGRLITKFRRFQAFL